MTGRIFSRANLVTAAVVVLLVGLGTAFLALRPTASERANADAIAACEAEAAISTRLRGELDDARVVDVDVEESTVGEYDLPRTITSYTVAGSINGHDVTCRTHVNADDYRLSTTIETDQ